MFLEYEICYMDSMVHIRDLFSRLSLKYITIITHKGCSKYDMQVLFRFDGESSICISTSF